MRLDKYLSDLGLGTRSEVKQLIKNGRIFVDGYEQTSPETSVSPGKNDVVLDGKRLIYRKYRYFMYNKPEGVITSTEDEKNKTVIDYLPDELKKIGLFPVGRLDKDTHGLLLLTNDGDFAHRVISPKSSIIKKYYAETDGCPDEKDVTAFAAGLTLRDGLKCLPAKLELLGENKCYVYVVEGKYHQVKRMLASVGKPVKMLKRVSIGRLMLPHDMPEGVVVELAQSEIDSIFIIK